MATLIIIATKINEITRMKLMKQYSIGAFPNMTMFNQISDLDVRQHHINVDYKTFGCMNQEINNQTQMLNNFSKYFDVLLINEMNQQNNNDDTFRNNNTNNNNDNNIDDANNSMMMEKFNVLMFVDEKILLMMDINNDNDEDFTAYDIVAIDDLNADEELKSKILKIITVLSQQPTLVNMNIPLLKFGRILATAGWCDIDIDGAVAIDSVLNDKDNKINYDNIYLMKQTMMAILHIVLNDNDKRIIQNSNNKKLTNNCKIEINTENINFSYYCDEYYEIIFNVSVFLSQKFDIMQIINKNIMNSSIMRMFMMEINKLQSHIKSFIVTDEKDDDNDDDDDDYNDGKIMKIIIIKIRLSNEKSSISSQSNTNKSEYAFEKTLNNDKKFYVANDKEIFSLKSMTMMESTSKLFLSSNFFSFFMQLLYPMMIKNKSFIQSYIRNYFYDDKDDAGYIKMISNVEMQLNCQKSLQSYKESDQQSGIVSNISCNNIKLVNDDDDDDDEANDKHIEPVKVMTEVAAAEENNAAIHMPDADYDRMNISELLFSHINDKNETLIDNTVNITCDFNYLNYNIISNTDNDKHNNNYKINDQIRKDNDETRFKDTTNYNNKYEKNTMTMMRKSANEITTEKKTNGNATTSKYQAMTQIDMLIECQQREKSLIKQYKAMSGRRMRLCGGAGDSLSGASGWGSPPSNTTTSSNPNAAQWGASAQQPPQQSWNQAAQQAGGGVGQSSAQQPSQQVPQQQNPPVGQPPQASAQKPLTPSGGWNQPPIPNQVGVGQPPQVPPSGNGAGIVGGGTSAVAAKNQLEQLNSMREALFSQDGWGCQNVNQDTNWDVPGSPEPGPRGDQAATAGGATQWKSHTVNNGTELWEANLRNGGQPPPQPVQKTPWNHTPTTNIGGTWGEEDDDNTENNSVWNASQNNQPAPSWNQNQNTSATNSGTMWPAAQGVGSGGVNVNVPKKDDWSTNAVGGGGSSNWDPRGPTAASNQMDIRNIDPRTPGTLDMRMMDARDQMQGNLRGVTGRLNGATSEMWQQGGMPGMPGINKTVGPNAGATNSGNNPQWPGMQGPKDLEINKPSGWDSSPPASRRPLGAGNFDDGTSLWGQSRVPGGGNGGGIQDPMARNNFGRNPIGNTAAPPTGIPPNRLPNAGMKPGEANTWGSLHPGAGNRNTWDDPHTPNWDDKPAHLGAGGIGTPWNEGPNAGPLWNKNKPSWPDSSDINSDWPQANKLSNTSSEIIRSSKQFRILAESGFKKDDAELALRTTNMNVEEAMELLQQQQRNANIEPWHHNAAPGTFDHSPFPGNRYPGPKMPFPPNNNPQMPNTNTGPGANIGLNNLPMQFNKHLPHQGGAPTAFSQQAVSASQSGQPSAHHLRNLVQQIQKAVQAGYLNHQILNQPLAPQTLQLLNSLLNAIQQLQMTQQSIQRNGGVNSIQLQMTIQKQKQQISTLQSQIAQQQALYIKSQAGGGGNGGGIGSGNDFLRQNSSGNMGMGVGNHNDPIASLETNLSNLGLKQDPTPYTSNNTSQQSRLNQWIKDNKSTDPDFSRAPGTTSSKQSLPPTTPTSISSIGLHNEPSTWSSGRNDGGWPDSSIDSENKDWPSSNQSPAFTDLVPEFQPGKPWKVSDFATFFLVLVPLLNKMYTINYLGYTKEYRR
ncbi:hypothetical protein ACKWTF_009160 [Chironomus riparius]